MSLLVDWSQKGDMDHQIQYFSTNECTVIWFQFDVINLSFIYLSKMLMPIKYQSIVSNDTLESVFLHKSINIVILCRGMGARGNFMGKS